IKGEPTPYDGEKGDQFQRMLTLECRNWEPVEFEFAGNWQATNEDGSTKYEDIEFDEEWMDVDDNGTPSSISNLAYEFKVTK
ncbi:hypothetical protein EV182_005287, partial [Spiromyces aspiralis]